MNIKRIMIGISVLALMTVVSCHKEGEEESAGNGNHASGYTEQDWDWNDSSKCQNGGIRIDTAWDSDTTINF